MAGIVSHRKGFTMVPAAFIFDCDGTLVDSMASWLRVQPRLLASLGVPGLTPADFAKFEHLSAEDECAAYRSEWGLELPAGAIYNRLMDMMEEAYRTEAAARPGMRAFLEEAAAAGIPMAVATSTPERLVRASLAQQGVEGYFENVTTTADAGASKEHPDVYNLALERLCAARGLGEVAPCDVWVFEDAVFGLKSSGSAGYRRVGIFDAHGRCQREDVMANCELFVDDYHEGLLGAILRFGE